MAKGPKLTPSRSERWLGSYATGTAAASESELREEEIWSAIDDTTHQNHHNVSNSQSEWSSRARGDAWNRRAPRASSHVGGLSLAFHDSANAASSRVVHQFRGNDGVATPRGARHMATSAPVNVPDWSKIYRVDSVESMHDSDDGFDDRDGEMVPPHEYLARSRKSTATSVFEGVGRTLKGRDMSRVRDAVWSQTGFDG